MPVICDADPTNGDAVAMRRQPDRCSVVDGRRQQRPCSADGRTTDGSAVMVDGAAAAADVAAVLTDAADVRCVAAPAAEPVVEAAPVDASAPAARLDSSTAADRADGVDRVSRPHAGAGVDAAFQAAVAARRRADGRTALAARARWPAVGQWAESGRAHSRRCRRECIVR